MTQTCPVSLNQYEELSEFLATFSGGTETRPFWLGRFRLWWEHNPAFAEGLDRGWVLRSHGRIVGFCGMIPTRFRRSGKDETIFSMTTWRVLPEHRSESLSLLFRVINASKQTMLFCTTPSDTTVAVLKTLKFELLPREDDRRSVIFINCRRVVSALLRDRVKRAPRLLPALSGVLARGLAGIQAVRLRRGGAGPAGMEVKELHHVDGSFDGLWEKTKDLYRNTNVRDARMIAWFCFASRDFGKKLFACYREGHLLGYAACWLNQTNRLNLRVVECLDLWADPVNGPVLGPLVQAVKGYAQEHSYDLVLFPHFNRDLGAELSKRGLIWAQGKGRREYFKVRPVSADEITAAHSYFVTAQGDIGL